MASIFPSTHKSLLVPPSLEKFYKDLQNSNYEAAPFIYEQRHSTNTFPMWPLVQQLIYKHLEANKRARAKEILAGGPKLASELW